jgi:hypothetical protein
MSFFSITINDTNQVLVFNTEQQWIFKMWICDMIGQELYSKFGFTSVECLKLDVDLLPGQYLVNISNGINIHTKKLLIE